MRVELLAHTSLNRTKLEAIGYSTHSEPRTDGWGDYYTSTHADELAEFAGRNCYRSFHRPNPETATNYAYLRHILDVGHESVLEHGSATFYIEASRSVLTELERHRHLSFSVVSQRYVDPEPLGYHIPPAVYELEGLEQVEAIGNLSFANTATRVVYEKLVEIFERNGFARKKAREAARAALPNMTSSPMVVSANHRAWRYVIRQRWHEAADAEIRELAGELLRQLREIAPNTYQDIPSTPYSY